MIQKFRIQNLQRKFLRTILGDDYTRSENTCRAAPEWLVLCINNFCNLHCKMCDVGLDEKHTVFYANLIGKNPQNMTLQLLNTILEQAESFWPRPRIGLAFTEPLVHVHILDFCRAIAQRGFYCSITTNGYLLPQLT
ncbi:MAG: radical SAM protein, partial [bacterium]